MHTKLTVEITGTTATWIADAAEQAGWSPNGLISYLINEADTLNCRGLLVPSGAEVPSIAGYDVQTKVEQTFEVGEMVNCEFADDEPWLTGMVLSIVPQGVEVQLTNTASAMGWRGASRDIWSVESLRPIK